MSAQTRANATPLRASPGFWRGRNKFRTTYGCCQHLNYAAVPLTALANVSRKEPVSLVLRRWHYWSFHFRTDCRQPRTERRETGIVPGLSDMPRLPEKHLALTVDGALSPTLAFDQFGLPNLS
jgi:hypothetical protein